jgi:hypothetical protein
MRGERRLRGLRFGNFWDFRRRGRGQLRLIGHRDRIGLAGRGLHVRCWLFVCHAIAPIWIANRRRLNCPEPFASTGVFHHSPSKRRAESGIVGTSVWRAPFCAFDHAELVIAYARDGEGQRRTGGNT